MSFSSVLPAFPLKLNLYNVTHLEKTLGYSIKSIRYFVDQKDKNVFKKTIIQNRNGKPKERVVYNTSVNFKVLLRQLNKKILQKAVFPTGVLGGIVGNSIDDMAKKHCGKEALFSIDLKDFFQNINSGMVFSMFDLSGCSNEICGLLTDLVTYNNFLPQGFPTSPMVANIIAYNLDVAHFHITKKNNLTRTRWIDDIVFSGRITDIKASTHSIVGAVGKCGFLMNKNKLHYCIRKSKPVVTGLCVNRHRPHSTDLQVMMLDKLITRCEKEGIPIVQATFDPDCVGKIRNLNASIYGKIRFISKYDPEIAKSFQNRFDSLLKSDII